MRAAALLGIAMSAWSCGGGAPVAQPGTSARDLDLEPGVKSASVRAARPTREPLDPILGLGDTSDDKISWVTPAHARLEIAGAPIDVAHTIEAFALPTTILDEQGSLVRVAVRLPHARFSLWTERHWLFSIVQRDTRVRIDGVVGAKDDVVVRLRAGARVRVIGRGEGVTHVRYVGELELVGWVPDDALADEGPHNRTFRAPYGGKRIHVHHAIIRSGPTWSSPQLAVTNRAHSLDAVKELPDKWYAVSYTDQDVVVRGYLQHHAPPGRTSPLRVDPQARPLPIAPNANARAATCLYAQPRGEPVGYLMQDQPVSLEPAREAEWWTISIDTPWGPILFAAHGREPTELTPCMPVASTAPTSP